MVYVTLQGAMGSKNEFLGRLLRWFTDRRREIMLIVNK
jgi:hypothetical protein